MVFPIDILAKRVQIELENCRELPHVIEAPEPPYNEFPLTINVRLVNVPGPIFVDRKIKHRYSHELKIEITRDYPYRKPVVRWKTEIFHPNIMPPEDGGYVCTKIFDRWQTESSLAGFLRGIETLLINPVPKNPFGCDACTRAAEYFNKHGYKPPIIHQEKKKRKGIRIIEG